ncbi:unnamed protein product [Mytilus coruscus]|uniref:DDE Tnp4 domain-containing protein n=1 Tax=Mytilus coruscus TaxID=42192 RepID=A0A6J8E848_MYTCO|nr:unnamed protein product [Mytilus coruscus]
MTEFQKLVELMHINKTYAVTVTTIEIVTEMARLLPSNHVPVGLFESLYKALVNCEIREKPSMEGCCESNIFGSCIQCNCVFPWYKILKAIMHFVMYLLQIKQIGPGLENDFPAHCFILADSIYPNAPPLVTPFKSTDIVRRPRLEQKRKRKFDLLHRKRRVYVEHIIKELKTFRVIGALYRHPRWEMASIVELCAALAKRRADLIKDVYS